MRSNLLHKYVCASASVSVCVCLRKYLHINTPCEKVAKFKMKRNLHTNCCIEKEALPSESVDFYAHAHTHRQYLPPPEAKGKPSDLA